MTHLPSPTDYSRYLARLVQARPELQDDFCAPAPLNAVMLQAWLGEAPLTEDNLKPALRRLKQRAMARIASRDLAGRADLAEVVESMTLVADVAVAAALEVTEAALVARYGEPRNAAGERQRLIIIGMGKLGGRELNVSSDIDLIFVYPEDGDTDGNRSVSNFEFFTRLGRSLINALADITGDGQVFRVDMRLRPNGDSGPLACSFDMLENYFYTQGREWERYAWIKARPMTPSTGDHWPELEKIRGSFVFRKYLDFGAINAMRDLHAQIRREVAKKDMANNVKLGPGGIREIEFIAQVFQLIRGGRDTALQVKPTLEVLKRLVDRGQLELEDVVALSGAYRFLRRLEHRLQYLDDAQTHALPENPDDQLRVAQAMGFGNYEALLMELDDHRQTVARHFEGVFADPNEKNHTLETVWTGGGTGGSEGHADELAKLGFLATASLCERLGAIRGGTRYQQMSAQAKGRFDALVPLVIQAASHTPNPDETLSRMLDLLEAIGRRAAYLALLLQYPQALEQVAKIAGASSWAADYLLRHPILLDELLDQRLLQMAPDWPLFRQQLAEQTDAIEPDTEQQMDVLREAHHAQVFRLVAQDIAGLLTVEKLSDHLSELADILVGRTIELAWLKLLTKHREQPAFAVIGYGKLGGKELGYASDLDLVYLFDDPAAESGSVYAKLGTRLNTWLSSRTAAGILFETDLRLRPNGDAGLVVSSLEAFRKYQLENAWVWEHQALTRARFVAGDPAIGMAFEQIRCEILCQQRDLPKLREEVLAMRGKMHENLGTKGASDLFDLKHDFGGLVDVEFIVQYLILAHAHQHPQLTGNLGNIALLRIAAECGLIPADRAEVARDAYREYRRLQHLRRLNNLDSRVDAAPHAERIAAVRALWKHVFGEN